MPVRSVTGANAHAASHQWVAPAGGFAGVAGARVILYTSADCWRGAGVSYINIARGLARHGFDPRIVALCPEVVAEFERAGVPVMSLPSGAGESRRLRRLLAAQSAELLIVDRAHDLRVATLAVAGTRTPVINRYNHFGDRPPTDLVTCVGYLNAVRDVVFLSASAQARTLAQVAFMRLARPATIYEGIDTTQFSPSRTAAVEFRRMAGLGATPFILAVGALAREKRYPFLLSSLRRLGDAAPALMICGEGPEEKHIRSVATAASLPVRFMGRIPQEMLIGAYNAAAALVHVGDRETFGLAVLEAMACARPIIACAGGAVPEVIGPNGQCGTLVPVSSPDHVADAIRFVLHDPDTAMTMARRARERARAMFSLTSMENGYATLAARNVAKTTPGAGRRRFRLS